jgi:S1-C subfamily serine protease
MPVCFLTTNDITGGNSGSPVMNGNGELIGLAFDGTWEAMSGDVAYETELQRTIAVDISMLWIMDVSMQVGICKGDDNKNKTTFHEASA